MAALTDIEVNNLVAAGVNKEQLTIWLTTWTRDELLELYQDDYPECFTGATTSKSTNKKGNTFCPICDKSIWVSRLDAHIFKEHMTELLAPYNKKHNADIAIKTLSVPLSIITPIFDHDRKPRKTKITIQPDTAAGSDEPGEHGQGDRYLNPKTNRMKLIEPNRPEKDVIPVLLYCLCCRKSWTSQKSARKHFFKTDGSPTECSTAKQILQINHLRGFTDAKYDDVVNIRAIEPNLKHWAQTNKEMEVLELKGEVKLQKQKIKKFADIDIKKDNEILRLKAIIEKLEGKIEADPACCPSCLRKDLKANTSR